MDLQKNPFPNPQRINIMIILKSLGIKGKWGKLFVPYIIL